MFVLCAQILLIGALCALQYGLWCVLMFGSCFAASRRVSVHWMHGCGGWVDPGCSGGQYLHNRNTQAAQWGNGLPRPTNNMKLKKELCKVPRFPAHVKRHREQDQCSCMTCLMDEWQKHTAFVLCVKYWCTLCIKIGCGVLLLMFDYNNVAASRLVRTSDANLTVGNIP